MIGITVFILSVSLVLLIDSLMKIKSNKRDDTK